MNRNSMHVFGLNPSVNIQRSKFDLDCTVKFTGNAADLIPFYCLEVLPGDTFEVKTSMVCRLQTLIHPIMDTMYLDTYYFFVPNRLIWDHWKNFCGEPDKAWLPEQEYTVPRIWFQLSDYVETDPETSEKTFNFNSLAGDFKDTIFDYMGISISPTMDYIKEREAPAGVNINALPFRAYNKVYDDWYRDENLIEPVNLYTGDNTVVWNKDEPLNGGKCYKAAKYHDYFTSCLPQAQRGNAVSLSAQTSGISPRKVFPVYSLSQDHNWNGNLESVQSPLHLQSNNTETIGEMSVDSGVLKRLGVGQSGSIAPVNLYWEWTNHTDLPLGITINDLRLAFQVQKFMEKSARGGARYIELIKEMFGVTSPDSRLQRSEYLGGHRIPITIHQIVNQTETIDTPLGNTGAMSLTSDVHNDFVHSFTEHGFIIGICCVRYKHSYSQGYYKMFDRYTKYDYYWPVFANIGEQPVLNRTICIGGNNQDVFGYQEAWAEYRSMFDRVAGEMRPGVPNSLASWHLGDYYDEVPTLSKDWIEEDIAPIDRAIAVTSSVSDQFLFDFYIENKATRPMPLYSIPGLVDHH